MIITIRNRAAWAVAAGLLASLAAGLAKAEDGVSADTITFGQAAVRQVVGLAQRVASGKPTAGVGVAVPGVVDQRQREVV